MLFGLLGFKQAFSQYVVKTDSGPVSYLDAKAVVILKKVQRLNLMYDVVYVNYSKNNKYIYTWSEKIIEDGYKGFSYNLKTKTTIPDFNAIRDYKEIIFRYRLVKKNPTKYKKFWNGWILRYIRDSRRYNYHAKIKY